MSNALGRAAQILQADIGRHGIVVNDRERYVQWREIRIGVSYGTPKSECLRKLRKLIRAAQELERKETQETLPL
jgi:hypothetical protein